MGALIDLTGKVFGKLTVKVRLPDKVTPSGARQPVWGCQCDCGRRTVEEGRALRAGRALSCRRCVRDPSRMLKYGGTYIAYWPTLGILKIGRRFRGSRLAMLRHSGAQILFDQWGTDASWERAGLDILHRLYQPAFTGPSQPGPHRADRILHRGRGWSECFLVEPHQLPEAFDQLIKAFCLKGNDLGYNPPATPTWARALRGIQRARAAGRPRGHRRNPAGARGPGRAAVAGRGTRPEAVAVPSTFRGERPARAAHPAAGGGRPCGHVGAGRPRMARVHTHASRAIFTGWGERGRGRTRTRESARAGAGARARGSASRLGKVGQVGTRAVGCQPHPPATSDSVGCPAAGLRGPSLGIAGTLRTVRHRGRSPRGVAGQAEVHRGARDLRGAARGRRRVG